MPREVHSKRGFADTLKKINEVAKKSHHMTGGIVLTYGLLLRELRYTHFLLADPDGEPPAGTPSWVIDSSLDMSYQQTVFDAIQKSM